MKVCTLKQCSKYVRIYLIYINILSSRTNLFKAQEWSFWFAGSLTNLMTSCVNMGRAVGVVYIDVSKASVKVFPGILVGKLVDLPWISGC